MNKIKFKSLPVAQSRYSDATLDLTASKYLVGAILTAGAGEAATLDFTNGSGGDTLMSLQAPLGYSKFIDLSMLGGICFSDGIYCVLAGTDAVFNVFYETDGLQKYRTIYLSSDGAIKATPCRVMGMVLSGATPKLTLYNNTAGSGTVAGIFSAASGFYDMTPLGGVYCSVAAFGDLGSGVTGTVFYE